MAILLSSIETASPSSSSWTSKVTSAVNIIKKYWAKPVNFLDVGVSLQEHEVKKTFRTWSKPARFCTALGLEAKEILLIFFYNILIFNGLRIKGPFKIIPLEVKDIDKALRESFNYFPNQKRNYFG